MVNYKAYFEIPEKNEKRKFVKGSAPHLLDIFLTELRGACEIEVSFFLYNNPYLHKFFEEESNKGCKITIVTIPISGYDSKLVQVKANHLQSINTSKKIYAEKILKRVQEGLSNIELRYYPHTNIWYRQETSRGHDSYALHNKSVLAKFPNGNIKCISSSCNFALGDPLHSENLLIIENCEATTKMFTKYMDLLKNNSLTVNEYYKFKRENQDFQFVSQPIDLKDEFNNCCYFTAPFITYDKIGSNHFVQQKIVDFLNSATNRIYLCSQHISDINPFDKNAHSIVNTIGEIAKNNNIEVKILKQTRAANQIQGNRTKQAENYLKSIPSIEQKYCFPTIHDKFLIVDNSILVTTANFTCTQFAWAENHRMKYYNENDNSEFSVNNTFSDVNSFHFINNQKLVDSYLKHFKNLWNISDIV